MLDRIRTLSRPYGLAVGIHCLWWILLSASSAATPGSIDPDFDPGVDPTFGTRVQCVALQPDGKIIIAGSFTSVGGIARNRIARLHADGSVDLSFNPNCDNEVRCAVLQPDGRILIGGLFTSVGGVTRNRIARLNSDGSLDTSFDPNCDNYVNTIALQADGRMIVGGNFTTVRGNARQRIARVNANGSLDPTFNPGCNSFVYVAAIQPDGKILLGGFFSQVAGVDRSHLARLNPNGTLDSDFNPECNGRVFSIAVLPDDKIMVGGPFSSFAGVIRRSVARLHPSGALDEDFGNSNANSEIYNVSVQTDGKVIVTGFFHMLGGSNRFRIARLGADGVMEPDFDPNSNAQIEAAMIQSDGKIVVGGWFDTIGGTSRSRIARLENGPATSVLSIEGTDHSEIHWLRGGTSHEAVSVSFESSIDGGATFQPLGEGERMGGGWKLGGLTLPYQILVRARAYIVAGRYNGSTGIIEETALLSYSVPPSLTSALPLSIGVTSATFAGEIVDEGGSEVLSRGIAWGSAPSPNLEDDFVEAVGTGTGAFSVPVEGLSPGATYYARPYATNEAGTGYGESIAFTTDQNVVFADGVAEFSRTIVAGDAHGFRFVLETPRVVTFAVDGDALLKAWILDANGNLLHSAEESLELGFERALPPGEYTLRLIRDDDGGPPLGFDLAIDASEVAFSRPDIAVGPSLGSQRGVGVYGHSSSQQAVLTSRRLKRVRGFATFANRGSLPDAISVGSSKGTRLFRVTHIGPQGNVTAQVTRGAYLSPVLEIGDPPDWISSTVIPSKRFLRRNRGGRVTILRRNLDLEYRVESSLDPSLVDAARLRVRTR